jgi:hypothetical protein
MIRVGNVIGPLAGLAAIVAAAIAVVNWAAKSADRILPILLSGAALITAPTLIVLCVYLLIENRRRHEGIGELILWVWFIFVGVVAIGLDLARRFPWTLTHARYRNNVDGLLFLGGSAWLAIFLALAIYGAHLRDEHKRADWAPRGKKLCPDCAEYPKKAARVCRYCGYRFEG